MTTYEKRAIEAFKSMWENWGSLNTISLEESISAMADQCKGFGSGSNEYWKDKASFIRYCAASSSLNRKGFEVIFKWITTDHLSEKIVTLCSEISISIELPLKKIIIEPVRITGVFKEINEKMKLMQWHISRPDASMQEEIWEGTGEPKFYNNVTILFTDFVGFSKQVSTISPRKLVDELNEIFAKFDLISRLHGIEKIKTIGDAYMAAKGLKEEKDHALSVLKAAKEMLQYLEERNSLNKLKWNMRIGIHSGAVVGGTIGSEKIGFDLWGDAVNVASRMESSGQANQINISKSTHELIKDHFDCQYRGLIEVKGNREIEMFFVL